MAFSLIMWPLISDTLPFVIYHTMIITVLIPKIWPEFVVSIIQSRTYKFSSSPIMASHMKHKEHQQYLNLKLIVQHIQSTKTRYEWTTNGSTSYIQWHGNMIKRTTYEVKYIWDAIPCRIKNKFSVHEHNKNICIYIVIHSPEVTTKEHPSIQEVKHKT